MGGTGFEVDSPSETTTDFLVTTCGNSDESENDNLGLTGAQTGALDAEDAGLQGLIDVWPRLPLDTIKQILKLAGLE